MDLDRAHQFKDSTRMEKLPLSVTIIALNEEDRIEKALQSVAFAQEIIVVDSGSQDRTQEVAKRYGAKVFSKPWEGYGQQKNYAHQLATQSWVLNLDADERVSPELKERLFQIVGQNTVAEGFKIPRKTFYLNRWITYGGWYPNYLVRLCKKNAGKWTEPPVHEELVVSGQVETLKEDIYHETFRSINDQVTTNIRYAKLGAERLLHHGKKIYWYHLVFKPIGKWVETYLIKKGYRDGLAGWIISFNAAHSIFLKFAFAWEKQENERISNRQ